jgi:thiol-disulfide isomerase/thioredoxin
MIFRTAFLLLLAIVFNAFVISVSHAQVVDEEKFLQNQKIPPEIAASFHDNDGRPIDFAEFITGVANGALFRKIIAKDTGAVEFRLRPFDEAAFREMHGIDAATVLSAYDADGQPIDFAQFVSAVVNGQDFRKTAANDTGAVEVHLKRLEEAELRTMLGIAPDAKLQLFDLSGAEIDFPRFAAALQGQRLGMSKAVENATGATKLQLEKVDTLLPANADVAADLKLPEPLLARVKQALGNADASDARPILLSFYFAECGPCIAEVPALNRLASASEDIRELAVTFDDSATTADFKKKHAFEWPVLSAAQDVVDALGVKTYPTFALIGADGTLKARSMSANDSIGGFGEKALRAWIDSSLATPEG